VNLTVIDYGVGNLRSLRRGLERADGETGLRVLENFVDYAPQYQNRLSAR